jgi:hypothetical protein
VTTTLAGENILAEMSSGIVDAARLRDTMMIYAEREVWAQEYVGGTFVFRFRKLFDDEGIINRNCAVEALGKHFVFGRSDLYTHDGVQKTSISEGRVRRWVFENMDVSKANRNFVAHDVKAKEILFCFVSLDSDAPSKFTGGSGCNRAMVYNYVSDTWSPRDLPNVVGPMSLAPSTNTLTFASADPLTEATVGGSFQDLGDGTKECLIATIQASGTSIPSNRLSFHDNVEKGSMSSLPLDSDLFSPAYLEKASVDLDTTGAALIQSKMLLCFVPLVRIAPGNTVSWKVGSSNIVGMPPTWGPTTTYDPGVDYKVDSMVEGRFLALHLDVPGAFDFSFSGLDAYFDPNGSR